MWRLQNNRKMADSWPIPIGHVRTSWRLSSTLTILAVAAVGKIYLRLTTKVSLRNWEKLIRIVKERPKGVPVVTISNHTSCIDDPLLWSLLPLSLLGTEKGQRWIPGAKEVIFTNQLYSSFFSRGKLVPVVRGDGVYQRGMDFLITKLNQGGWVHVFPEGKVNLEKKFIRLKWGVGRLIAECSQLPIVLPLWHIGMDNILPNHRPYIPRVFQKLTVAVGDPIDLSFLTSNKTSSSNAVTSRKEITDLLQAKLQSLKLVAEEIHENQ